MGEQKTSSHDSLNAIFGYFGLDAQGKSEFRRSFKNQLFAGPLFPDSYKQAFVGSLVLQREVRQIIAEVDDLIGASASVSVITAGRNDGPSVALQLYAIIGAGITQERLNGYENYKIMASGINLASGTTYIRFMEEMKARLEQYEGAKRYEKYDKAENENNARLEHRITVLKEKITELRDQLLQPYGDGEGHAEAIAEMQLLREDIDVVERAWDVDLASQGEGLDKKVKDLQDDPTAHNTYSAEGGVDDGVAVGDEFEALKACSLYALLALRPGWMGADTPQALHAILRKSKDLKDYDDDATVARIRFMAGLKPTMTGGKRLEDFINEDIFGEGDDRPNFIVDPSGAAHTFAAVWDGAKYVVRDNEAAAGTDIMALPKWKKIKAGTVWM